MRCPSCGSDANDSARFCTQCGASLADAESMTAEPKSPSPDEEAILRIPLVENAKASFKEALDSSKRKSRRRMPVLLLVALGMFLSATLAWAAYNAFFGASHAGEEELPRTESVENSSIDLGDYASPVPRRTAPPLPEAPASEAPAVEPIEQEPLEETPSEPEEEVPPAEAEPLYSGWIIGYPNPTSSGSYAPSSPHEEFFTDLTQSELDALIQSFEGGPYHDVRYEVTETTYR